jgi:hypothetical protein
VANHKITASGTTRVEGVGNRTVYTRAAPAPRLLPVNTPLAYNVISVATGSPFTFAWPDLDGAVFDVEVRRLSSSSLAPVQTMTVQMPGHSLVWTPTKVALYSFRVRANPGPWIDSMDHSADGARGWIVQTYLAPVSGGGIS